MPPFLHLNTGDNITHISEDVKNNVWFITTYVHQLLMAFILLRAHASENEFLFSKYKKKTTAFKMNRTVT